MIIYVEQYDCFWRLSKQQWREIVEAGLSGAGYDLSRYPQLKSRPKSLRKTKGERHCYSINNRVTLKIPLDFTHDDWINEVEDF